MREIKFRGKTDHHWVYGLLSHVFEYENTAHIIVNNETLPYSVYLGTLGQFTGQYDSKRTKEYPNGQEIWEGDRLRYNTGFGGEPKERDGVVVFKNGAFMLDNASMQLSWYISFGCEVIGNIHEEMREKEGEKE